MTNIKDVSTRARAVGTIAGAALVVGGIAGGTIAGYQADASASGISAWATTLPIAAVILGVIAILVSVGYRAQKPQTRWMVWGLTAFFVLFVAVTALITAFTGA
mgnify:CR=1 FL=1